MRAAVIAVLIGVVHVHHGPSHDSDAPFEAVLAGARAAALDFLILTEHVEAYTSGPLPAADLAGSYPRNDAGAETLVMVGVEVPTIAGHLLALDVPSIPTPGGRPARDVIAEIHRMGGFAVVPHPFSHGGWRDWDAPFDGLEVHNNASEFRRSLGPLLPFELAWMLFDPEAVLRRVLVRPSRELERWESLLASGRRVVAFSGADAHNNQGLLGWRLDPYARAFRSVQTLCPEGPLEPRAIWTALRSGRCRIRYAIHAGHNGGAREVVFPSGRSELQLDGGRRLLEIRQPPFASPVIP